jgi:excisionase family DNA binding protein
MPVPICRTVQEAYDAGRADALAMPTAEPQLAAMVAGLIEPWLREIAAHRHKLLTVPEVADQLGLSKGSVYELMYRGEFASIQIPSENGLRATRRIEQTEIDAFIARYRVSAPETRGGVL